MRGILAALACACLLAGARASTLEPTWTGSETDLYQSVYWEPQFGNLIIIGDGAETQKKFDSFKDQLSGTDVFLVQVSCGSEESRGEVCTLLSEHKYGLRNEDDKLTGVDVPEDYESSELAYLLQLLLGDKLTFLSSYSELRTETSQRDSLFLVYVLNTTSEEYLQLLKVWIVYRVSLFVVTQINTLPLSYRPSFSFSPKPLYLWHLQQSGQRWLKFFYGTSSKDESQDSFQMKLTDFVDRLRFPIVANSDEGIEEQLEGTTYHIVYIFPAIGKGLDIKTLAENVARTTYPDFIFIIGKRDTDKARELFVIESKTNPHVVVLPYGDQSGLFSLELESADLNSEADFMRGVLESHLKESPRTGNPEDIHAPPLVSLLDTEFFYGIIKEKRTDDVLVSFCLKDGENCPGLGYEALRDVMVALQRDGIKQQFSSLIAHVVECDSVDDVETYGFKSLPAYGLYNHTRNKWHRVEKELTKAFQAMALVVLSSGLDELIGLDLSTDDSLEYSPDDQYSTPLTEDDHFALILKTLPAAPLPKDSSLTSDNFDSHISQFERTVVVFYMTWCPRSQVFLTHVVAAYKSLDTAAHNVSLAVVKCDDWTDLCTRVGITTFPTVLLFTPDTLHTPTPLTHLSTPHILNALGQRPLESDDEELLELTPNSLPSLLGGDLATPLVVWCDNQLDLDKKEAFKQVALRSKGQSDWSFAWINSSKYRDLLSRVTQTQQFVFPTVVVLKLSKREVYQFSVEESQTVQEFSEGLEIFLNAIASGDLQPSVSLVQKNWPPVQPPVHFPSAEDYEPPSPDGKEFEQQALPFKENAGPTNEDQLGGPPHRSTHTEL